MGPLASASASWGTAPGPASVLGQPVGGASVSQHPASSSAWLDIRAGRWFASGQREARRASAVAGLEGRCRRTPDEGCSGQSVPTTLWPSSSVLAVCVLTHFKRRFLSREGGRPPDHCQTASLKSILSKSILSSLVQNLRVQLARRIAVLHRGLRFGIHLCRQQDEGEVSAAAARHPGDAARGRSAADPATSGRSPGPGQPCPVRAAPSCSAFVPTVRPGAQCLLKAQSRAVLMHVCECFLLGDRDCPRAGFRSPNHLWPCVALSSGCTWLCRLAVGSQALPPRAGRPPGAFSRVGVSVHGLFEVCGAPGTQRASRGHRVFPWGPRVPCCRHRKDRIGFWPRNT